MNPLNKGFALTPIIFIVAVVALVGIGTYVYINDINDVSVVNEVAGND